MKASKKTILANSSRLACAASVIALGSLCSVSFAQGAMSWKLQCVNVGYGGQQEKLGDREGHAISVSEYTCRTEGGPMDGAVVTGNAVWEWNDTTADLRAGSGVYRKPGTVAVYDRGEGKLALKMTDGKVTGWSVTRRGAYNVATGSAAVLAGKSWSLTAYPTGANQFAVDVKVD